MKWNRKLGTSKATQGIETKKAPQNILKPVKPKIDPVKKLSIRAGMAW